METILMVLLPFLVVGVINFASLIPARSGRVLAGAVGGSLTTLVLVVVFLVDGVFSLIAKRIVD